MLRRGCVILGCVVLYADTDDDPTICTADTAALRDGVSFPHGGHRVGGLEDLLFQNNVDFYFSGTTTTANLSHTLARPPVGVAHRSFVCVSLDLSGHMHSYERLYPTYRGQRLGSSYTPLIAPLHIIAGAAGCQELLDSFDYIRYPWSAVTSDSYGYGKFIVYNATHAEWQQILDEDGSVLDHIVMTKAKGGYAVPMQANPDEPEVVHRDRHNRK